MIKLTPNPTFKVEVLLPVPGEEKPGAIELTVRYMSRTARETWFKASVSRNEAEALNEIIADWAGPLDDQGAPVPYSLDALRTLCDHYEKVSERVLTAIAHGYREGRVKNS
jgi:hypothetical protein